MGAQLITHETKAIHLLIITCQSTTQLTSQGWDFKRVLPSQFLVVLLFFTTELSNSGFSPLHTTLTQISLI
jgi:hypothetical protein